MLLGARTKQLNRYSVWQYLVVFAVIAFGLVFALPNIFGEDYAVQITAKGNNIVDTSTYRKVERLLERENISPKSIVQSDRNLLVRLLSSEDQLRVQKLLLDDISLSRQYIIALNLAPSTPGWLKKINAKPMYLGLDLRGGVYFLLDVDIVDAVQNAIGKRVGEVKRSLRGKGLRYKSVKQNANSILVHLRQSTKLDDVETLLNDEYPLNDIIVDDGARTLSVVYSDSRVREIQDFAVKQNITTLRNRVNELGVAEPIIQKQGASRIVVQLPGVQDTARAKEVLGAIATLEYRMVAQGYDARLAASRGYGPVGTNLYYTRAGEPILLNSEVIVTGENVINAQSGIDQQSGSPMVSVTLDGVGGKRMLKNTRTNINRSMGVVFIQTKTEKRRIKGKLVPRRTKTEVVINVATIREAFSNRFQTTGLDSSKEASDLALLLRAGALAAPMDIVEERTIGPSLGQDSIEQGFISIIVGLCLVLIFMLFRYKTFGLLADIALVFNLIMIISLLSLMQATLTLPGIAGIVLTVGMAVDANVLIFERIREELALGSSVPKAIDSGYSRALVTISDANITTLIAAVVLFGFGTGAIKGFAITLSFGIITSMFTAIVGTRSIVNLLYGRSKNLKKLPI